MRMPPHMPRARHGGEYSGAAAAIGWDRAQGYLFPPVNVDGSRGTGAPKAVHMTASLQAYPRRPDVPPPDSYHAMHHKLRPRGRSREPLTRRYHGRRRHVSGRLEVRRSSSEVYRGLLHPTTTERRRSRSHEQAYMDANVLSTLPEFAKTYAAFPRKGP